MGNQQSSLPQVRLSLAVDLLPTSYYVAGQILSGSLFADSSSSSSSHSKGQPDANAGADDTIEDRCNDDDVEPGDLSFELNAYVIGVEKTRSLYSEVVHRLNSNGNVITRHETRVVIDERRIATVRIPLLAKGAGRGDSTTGSATNAEEGEGGSIVFGRAGTRHEFPFRVQLPHDLPSTMQCSESGKSIDSTGGFCEIAYKVRAVLKVSSALGGSDGKGDVFRSAVTEQPIRVLAAPPPTHPLPHSIEPRIEPIHRIGGCLASCSGIVGSIAFAARVPDARAGAGEVLAVDLAIRNKSPRRIDSAEVRLVEDVVWSAEFKENVSRGLVLASAEFRGTDGWDPVAGEAGRREARLAAKSLASSSSSSGGGAYLLAGARKGAAYEELHRAMERGECRAELKVPTSARPSYRGRIVRVEHRIVIVVRVEGSGLCCLSDSIEATVPAVIGSPATIAGGRPDAPPKPANGNGGGSDDDADGGSRPLVTAAPVAVLSTTTAADANADAGLYGDGDDANDGGGTASAGGRVTPTPSLSGFLRELEMSVNPVRTARERARRDHDHRGGEWRRDVLASLTPSEYGSVVKAVPVEFDQPDVAAIVASAIRGDGGGSEGRGFTSDYVIEAVRCVSPWLRVAMVQKLVPLCADLKKYDGDGVDGGGLQGRTGLDRIKSELSDWERICAGDILDGASLEAASEQIENAVFA